MITKTVDSIVREALLEEGLSMHFYVGFLLHALTETQRLSMMHGMHVKQQQFTINGYNRIAIPDDVLYIIDVSIKNGDRLLPAARDNNLNRMYNIDNTGTKIPHPTPEGETLIIDYNDTYLYNYGQRGFGGFFGLSAPQDRTFNIDYENCEIVFSNEFNRDVVVVTYASDPVSCSSCNLVRYEFVDTIKAYIKFKYLQNSNVSNQYQIESAREDYYTRKRNMKSLIYPVTRADLVHNIRKGLHAGAKK